MRLLSFVIGMGVIVVAAVSAARLWWPSGLEQSFDNPPLVGGESGREEESVDGAMSAVETPLPIDEAKSGTTTETPTQAPVPAPPSETAPEAPSIVNRLLGFGYRVPPSPRTIDTIIIHSSYNASGGDVYDIDKIIGQYEQYGVGAHYLIGRKGTIFRLVEEKNIAYHAGVAKMPDGRTNVNDFSIGIEIVGTEKSGFTNDQYRALNTLIADIKGRYKIKSVVGHSDIAPGRKTDPWEFDWKKIK